EGVQQHHPASDRGGEAGVGDPGEDHLVIADLPAVRVDVGEAEDLLPRGDRRRIGFVVAPAAVVALFPARPGDCAEQGEGGNRGEPDTRSDHAGTPGCRASRQRGTSHRAGERSLPARWARGYALARSPIKAGRVVDTSSDFAYRNRESHPSLTKQRGS